MTDRIVIKVENGVSSWIAMSRGRRMNSRMAKLTSRILHPSPQINWVASGSGFSPAPVPVPSLSQLVATLSSSASIACASVTSQIVPDATHQNAYVNAANMVGPSATVPTDDPAKSAFAAMAAAFGAEPQAFATLVANLAAASLTLSAVSHHSPQLCKSSDGFAGTG